MMWSTPLRCTAATGSFARTAVSKLSTVRASLPTEAEPAQKLAKPDEERLAACQAALPKR